MKIFRASKIRELDEYTIQHQPIASIDLMEQAATSFANWFSVQFDHRKDDPIIIICGPGNNGGDGFAIARLLHHRFFNVSVYLCKISDTLSRDAQTNYNLFKKIRGRAILEIEQGDTPPDFPPGGILIDGIFGSGLNRPVTGYWAAFIEHLNKQPVTRVAIDIPSGLFADQHTAGVTIKADYTISFELPKLAFFFAENQDITGEWFVLPIGLSEEFIEKEASDYCMVTPEITHGLLHKRKKFDHKGTFGHALIIAGAFGKVGAAIMAAKACMRSGSGLVTIHAPRCAYTILQIAFPEAMASVDRHEFVFSDVPNINNFDVFGIGPGLGTNKMTQEAFYDFLKINKKPVVIDADGLNILAKNPEWFKTLHSETLLTPHPKEFERMFGVSENEFSRTDLLQEKAKELNIYILLKGAYTALACPDGKLYFNSTGNPGMATGGSGDVLTGVIAGLLAQHYTVKEAALLGAFVHGLAGDLASAELEHEALIATDIIQYLGPAFQELRNFETEI